ncbi:hypothetical protein ACT72W_11525 [Ornithobacterium rhinotracheale]|uniref:hypothetical protein n=1 Tax=Ornithobacterium rhinotracheale TaxID=28251 RepID=UPI0040396641
MTQREKRKIKFWLFIFLVIFILFWFTEKKSLKEKITTGDGSVIPLDLEKLKAPAPILPKVETPKFDSVFAKGGSAVRNEKAFNNKVEAMMQSEKQKGKIPVKSDVIKKVQEEEQKNEEEKPCTDCGGGGYIPTELKKEGELNFMPNLHIPSLKVPTGTNPYELENFFKEKEQEEKRKYKPLKPRTPVEILRERNGFVDEEDYKDFSDGF